MPAIESSNVVNDFGTVQGAIGQLLGSTEKFWVDAQKDSQASQSLYKYGGYAPIKTFHLPSGTENHQGDCLTYSSANDELVTMVRII